MESSTVALPLTGPQYGMWAGQQLDPDSPSFWTAEAIELSGPLDLAALEAALCDTLSACDALHMRYRLQGEEVVQTLDAARPVVIAHQDYSNCEDPWRSARAWMDEDLQRSADLAQRPLFATALIRLGEHRHLWYLRAHHIALDGFAYLLLIHRVAELYSAGVGGRAAGPARDWSLAATIADEAAYRASPRFLADRDYWTQRFGDVGEPATLGPKCAPDDSSHSQRRLLAPAEYARWQTAARGLGTDWATWLIASIFAWLHARSGASDLSLGLLVMNRLGTPALAVPCMAMNVVPLRLRIDPQQGFEGLVRTVAGGLRELRSHQRYNYEWMRRDLGLADGHAQLYGPVVNLMPFDRGFVFEGLHSRAHPISVGSVEDLDITVSPMAEGIRFDIEANPQAYDAATLQAHHAALCEVLDAVIAEPAISVGALARQISSPRTAEAA
ncbi:condensation domain-containing protein [Lysobacter antibioticus]|uniref:condensation domain-containing protein n=1 Tax=Lysobacter antibioticus TaxID=84531 RepID=UPI00071707B4|nr:condensation domain-containing protein [Lysobacter antibioticus]